MVNNSSIHTCYITELTTIIIIILNYFCKLIELSIEFIIEPFIKELKFINLELFIYISDELILNN